MEKFKKIWFGFLMLLLFLPLLQGIFGVVKEKPLDGAFVDTPKPNVNFKALVNETVQDSLTTYCTEQTGFRKSFIRLNNQLMFSVFGESPSKYAVKGKDDIYFEESYVISYTGETYVGEDMIEKTTRQVKLIQDMLKAKGVDLLPVFALGKASYYPECIPEKYLAKQRETNNYREFLKAFERHGLNYIDFNEYLCQQKGNEAHAFYCNLSAHWTVYAASLAMDSLVNYMEAQTGKEQVHLICTGYEENAPLMNQDDDVYKMMNLIFPVRHNPIDRPVFEYTEGEKPKVLSIADSYWWTVWAWDVSLPQHLFSDGGFWFYNRTVYPEREGVVDVTSLDYKKEIESQDFVLLLCTEATNHLWPYGFCERYLSAFDVEFMGKSPADFDAADSLYAAYRSEEIDKTIERINNTPEWLENVQRQAEEKGVPLEQMLYDNAEYAYRMDIQPKGFCH